MRGLIRAFGAGSALAAALACGGLPATGDEAEERVTNDAAEGPAPPPEPAPAPAPAGPPESLFEVLDAAEVPPTGGPTCAEGTSTIRHPRGNAVAVYCADGAGKKQGALHLVKGSRVVELTDYLDGRKTGRSVQWSDAKPPVKRSESRWVDDVQEGDAAEWDEAGNLVARGRWAAGQKVGKFIASTAVDGAAPTFGGACHDAGAEVWTTTDPAEFVGKACP
jgi:hypothetical protein